jgi:hypothetical protein
MEATIGDQICIHGNTVGHADRTGEIIEVHGMRGEPPYLVRFADGQTRLLFPGPDAVIVPQQRRASDALPVPRLPPASMLIPARPSASPSTASASGRPPRPGAVAEIHGPVACPHA